jgi:hypothetical protein
MKFMAIISDSLGRIVRERKDNGKIESLIKEFKKPQDALRWTDRRLFENPNCSGKIEQGGILYEHVHRDDSIARILKRPRALACRKTVATQSRLSFGMSVHSDVCHFSQG